MHRTGRRARALGRLSLATALALAAMAGCSAHPGTNATLTAKPEGTPKSEAKTEAKAIVRPAGWSDLSHGSDVNPNYATVFPRDHVNKLAITIKAADWQAMLAEMTRGYGQRGVSHTIVPPDDNASFMPCTIGFNGEVWTDVAIRFKGESSLKAAWVAGTDKLPFRLDFDHFADTDAGVTGQRLYGFDDLSLATGFDDPSGIREALAADLLADSGLPAARVAPYEVTLDYGSGVKPLGVYAVVEAIEDTAVKRIFGTDDGHIYKPNGPAAGFNAGDEGAIEASFEKQNHKSDNDWSDVDGVFYKLQADTRKTDPATWRAGLDRVFDTKGFLKWLAIANLLQLWDAYGILPHNYYLYDNPQNGQMTWISWDHDMILDGAASNDVSFSRADVGPEWPLIRYLLDDPVYLATYHQALTDELNGPFNADSFHARCEALEQVVVTATSADAEAIGTDVDKLEAVAVNRMAMARDYLASPSP